MSKQNPSDPQIELRRRIEQAQREKRWKDAVGLAQQLTQQAGTADNQRILRASMQGLAQSLADRKRTKDLAKELPGLLAAIPGDPTWGTTLAEIAMQAGLVQEGLQLLPADNIEARNRAQGIVADTAVQRGAAGGVGLSPDLQADHLRILKAFQLAEQKKDEEARAELQGVGLRSPFAEWRMFLRGLLAYYNRDDAQALQAWARLVADRLPFRLAAPLRQSIDPSFRNAQSRTTQHALTRQYGKVHITSRLPEVLTRLHQKILQQEGSLKDEFTALQALKLEIQTLPLDLNDRLRRAVYWAMIPAPEHVVQRYQRALTPPPEDPSLHRHQALAAEEFSDPEGAMHHWLAYEKQIAHDHKLWGEDSDRVRALIYLHVGDLARSIAENDDEDEEEELRPRKGSAKPVQAPTPDSYFQRCRELAPDMAEAYLTPLEWMLGEARFTEARPLAEDVCTRFPEDLNAQILAGIAFAQMDQPLLAQRCLDRAARINPLDRQVKDLRKGNAGALVRFHLRGGTPTEANGALALLRSLKEKPEDEQQADLLEAAIAWKSGDLAPVEALRQQMESREPAIVVLHKLLVEAEQIDLPRKARTPLEREFKEKLNGSLALAEAMALGQQLAQVSKYNPSPYRGFKTHRDTLVRKLQKVAVPKKLSALELLQLGQLYFELKAKRPVSMLATAASQRNIDRVVWHYLEFLRDVQSGRTGGFFGQHPVFHLRHVVSALQVMQDSPVRQFLQERVDYYTELWDLKNLEMPFSFGRNMFSGFEEDFDI